MTDTYSEELDNTALLDIITEAMLEKKASNVVILDVSKLTSMTDFFVICDAETDTQVKAISENVSVRMKELASEPAWQKEGLDVRRWVILDYVDIVVHVFQTNLRNYYNLEKMWSDAIRTEVVDQPR
jgi:ribosome-associated protein